MNDEPIQAGAGCGTIHFPDALFPTEGFVGIHDGPHFRIFLLRQGRSAFLLASAELVMLDDALLDVCRSQLEQLTKVPLADIWIHVTHAISTSMPRWRIRSGTRCFKEQCSPLQKK